MDYDFSNPPSEISPKSFWMRYPWYFWSTAKFALKKRGCLLSQKSVFTRSKARIVEVTCPAQGLSNLHVYRYKPLFSFYSSACLVAFLNSLTLLFRLPMRRSPFQLRSRPSVKHGMASWLLGYGSTIQRVPQYGGQSILQLIATLS